MSKPTVLISLETEATTETSHFGRAFIGALCDEDQKLVPEFVSESETFREPFVDIDSFVDNWWAKPRAQLDSKGRVFGTAYEGPMWKRKSALASRGMILHGLTNVRGGRDPAQVWFDCRWSPDVNFSHLFDAWVELARPEIAMLHVFTEPELSAPQSDAERGFQLGSFGSPQTGIPNMGWAMAFGSDYSSEIDVKGIAGAGFEVREGSARIAIKVTSRLNDVVENFAVFSQRRAKLKSLFRPGFFWIAEEPLVHR